MARKSNGTASLRSSTPAWCRSGSPTAPGICSSSSAEETRPFPVGRASKLLSESRPAPGTGNRLLLQTSVG